MSSSAIYDITNLVTDITWSGDINTYSRTLSLSVMNTEDMEKRLIKFDVGHMVFFYVDNKEVFRGYLFKLDMGSDGKETLTCYDMLIYTAKNSDTMLIKNKTASEIVTMLCKKYDMPIGKIQSTGYKISKKLCENQTLDSIIKDALDETKANTNGKGYRLYSEKGKVNLVGRYGAAQTSISVNNLISASKEKSIEDLKNKVMVTKGSLESDSEVKFASETVTDTASTKKYGTMQHVEQVDDTDSTSKMKAKAKSLLKDLSQPTQTLSIEFIGDVSCVTGNIIHIQNNLIDAKGSYYITSDSHTFSGGSHKMTLQLSTKLE
jgi:hypothetical protein